MSARRKAATPERGDPILEYAQALERETASAKIKRLYQRLAYYRTVKDQRWAYAPERAWHVIDFCERFCKQSKGPLGGTPLRLELWQRALLAAAFGWIDPLTGDRKYREVFLDVGRKNGKSTLAAAVGLYLMVADQEAGPEIFSAATKKDQAKIVWLEAKRMVKKSPALVSRIRPRVADLISDFNDGSFRPLGRDSDTLDGLNVHGALLDEIHAWPTKDLYDVIVDGAGARSQPMIFCTTTAGTVRESIYDLKYDQAKVNLEADHDDVIDDRFLPVIYELDRRAEWTDPRAWRKANPGLGTIKNAETLADKVEQAKRNPRLVKNLLCKEFNIPETSSEAWLPFEVINNEARFDIHELKPRYAVGGVDLSATTDLTCATLLFAIKDAPGLYCAQMYWLPDDLLATREKDDRIPYTAWRDQGLLRTCAGNRIHYRDVVEWFAEMQAEVGVYIPWVGYDSWSAGYFVEDMRDAFGPNCMEPVIQGKKTLSEPMKALGADLQAKRINYNNNPILKWCITNTAIDVDRNGNIQPIKMIDGRRRIDGLASLLDAYVVYQRHLDEYLNLI